MKRVLLVSPLLFSEHRTMQAVAPLSRHYERTPPLGILTVAALLRDAGVDVAVFDASRAYYRFLMAGNAADDFAAAVAGELAADSADVVGFSTLCDSYPWTLQVAAELRALAPDPLIVLGGAQASATAADTLLRQPAVDAILTGEVEESIPLFVQHYPTHPNRVPGLVYRQGDGVRTNAEQRPEELDAYPFPAYDLWFEDGLDTLPVEVGRGCPFNCRFCSTSGYFGRRFRLKTPDRLLAEVRGLATRYAPRHVVLVHDHFAVDPARVRELCQRWRGDETLAALPWMCSARLDSLTPAVLQDLHDGGCRRVFVGVETGSQRLQKATRKGLDVAAVPGALARVEAAGLAATVSFIGGYPDETEAEFDATLDLIGEVLRQEHQQPQLAVLAALPGSAYAEELTPVLRFDGQVSPLLGQVRDLSAETTRLVRTHAPLFTAHYAVPLDHLEARHVRAASLLVRYAFPAQRDLLLLAVHLFGSFARAFAAWYDAAVRTADPADHGAYLGPELLAALRGRLREALEELPNRAPLRQAGVALLSLHERPEEEEESSSPVPGAAEEALRWPANLHALPCPIPELRRALRAAPPFAPPPERPALVWVRHDGKQRLYSSPEGLPALVLWQFRRPTTVGAACAAVASRAQSLLPPDMPVLPALEYTVQRLVNEGMLVRA